MARAGVALDVDVRGLDHVLARFNLASKNVRKAARFAINDSGRKARTAIRRAVRKDLGVTLKIVARYSRERRATDADLQWAFHARNEGIMADYLDARPTRAGITFRYFGSRKLAQHFGKGFWVPPRGSRYSAPGNKANFPVMARTGPRRYPLKPVRGPSLHEGITRGAYKSQHTQLVAREFPRNFARHARRFGVVF